MAQTFGTFKSIMDRRDQAAIARSRAAAAASLPTTDGDDGEKDAPRHTGLPRATHQERVNVEMFKAIAILGRKIERGEQERDRLTPRLALIESAATVDEATGRLYLPVSAGTANAKAGTALPPPGTPAPGTSVPRWMMGVTLVSTTIALAALALVALRPAPTPLTDEQLSILNALSQTRMGALTLPLANSQEAVEKAAWQSLDTLMPQEATPLPALAATAPDTQPATTPSLQDHAAESSAEGTVAPEREAQGEPEALTPAPEARMTPAQEQEHEQAQETRADATEDLPEAAPAKAVLTADGLTEPRTRRQEPPPLVAGLDIGRDHNLPKEITSIETRAMEGNPSAQHDLAAIYAAGQQVPQDYKRAAYWFAQAAEGGVANAHYNLGVMFQQGLGLRQDTARAISWYEKAAALDHPEALYNLGIAYIEGIGVPRKVETGIDYFTRAARAGVIQAAFNLGVLHESGFAGPIDIGKARDWYEAAAKDGHTEAREALTRIDSQRRTKPSRGGSTGRVLLLPPAAQQMDDTQKTFLTAADMVEPSYPPGHGDEEPPLPEEQGDAMPRDSVGERPSAAPPRTSPARSRLIK